MDESSSRTSKWIKTLGLGALGGFAIAFAWSLIAFWSEMPAGEEAAAPTTDAETAAPAAEGPTDLRAHQQHVSDVLADLNRDVLVASSPTRGNPDADIVMLKFSDFQCPFCAQATTEVGTFLADAKDEVLFVYKHLPLIQSHPEAVPSGPGRLGCSAAGPVLALSRCPLCPPRGVRGRFVRGHCPRAEFGFGTIQPRSRQRGGQCGDRPRFGFIPRTTADQHADFSHG
jgi:hypothetical protein